MEVSGEPLTPTASPPQKDPPVHIEYGLGGCQSWSQCLEKIKSRLCWPLKPGLSTPSFSSGRGESFGVCKQKYAHKSDNQSNAECAKSLKKL